MKTIDYTTFRNKSGAFFDEVEAGETLVITRHGKPIGKFTQLTQEDSENIPKEHIPSWKRKVTPVKLLKDVDIVQLIRDDRDASVF